MGYFAGAYGQTIQTGILGALLGLMGGFTCAFGKNMVEESAFLFHSKLLFLFGVMMLSAMLTGWYGTSTIMGFSEGFSFGLRAGFLCGLTMAIYFPRAPWGIAGMFMFIVPGCVIGILVGGLATQDWGAGASGGGFIGLVVTFCVFLIFFIGVFDEQISPSWIHIQKEGMPAAFLIPVPILSIFILIFGFLLQSLISSLVIVHVCMLATVWISYIGGSVALSNPRKNNPTLTIRVDEVGHFAQAGR